MTYNKRSKTMSTRIDPDALAVLEWHARLTGVPLRRWLRDMLQERAESITAEYDLDMTQPLDPPVPPVTAAVLDDTDESVAVIDPVDAFVDRVAATLGVDRGTVTATMTTDDNGICRVVVNGVTFTSHPVTQESHP